MKNIRIEDIKNLDRDTLKRLAKDLGMKSDVNRQSTKRLISYSENNIKKLTNSKENNLRLGVDRPTLKKLAKDLGMKSDVNRQSTKRLEDFVQNNLTKKGQDKVQLTDKEKADVKAFFNVNYSKGKNYLANKIAKTLKINHNNITALRQAIEKEFSVYYEGVITKEMLDELQYNRLEYKYLGEAFNKLNNTFEYADILEEYANELNMKEETKRGENNM